MMCSLLPKYILYANPNQNSKTMRYSFSVSHTSSLPFSLLRTHTRSISTAGCQVLKLSKRSLSTEGFSSRHSMWWTTNSVYTHVCVLRAYVFSWHLSTLAAACLLAPTGTNLSLGFGWVYVCDVWVHACVGEAVERSGHYHRYSQRAAGARAARGKRRRRAKEEVNKDRAEDEMLRGGNGRRYRRQWSRNS